MITPIFRPDIIALADTDLRNIDFVRGKFAECLASLDARDAELNRLGGLLLSQQSDLSAARDQIVQQSSALAQKDVFLSQQKSDLALRDQRIAELVGLADELRGKLDAATLVPPRITVENLVAQFRTDIEKINHDARLSVRGMVVDNLEVEIKGGIDISKGVCLTQLPANLLDAQSASTLRFSLKPAATLRMVDDD